MLKFACSREVWSRSLGSELRVQFGTPVMFWSIRVRCWVCRSRRENLGVSGVACTGGLRLRLRRRLDCGGRVCCRKPVIIVQGSEMLRVYVFKHYYEFGVLIYLDGNFRVTKIVILVGRTVSLLIL